MQSRIARWLLTVVGIGLLFSCSPGPNINLELNLQKGGVYFNRYTTEQTIEQTIQGQSHSIEQSIVLGQEFIVDDIDSLGNYAITMRFTEIGFKQTTPMGSMEYDSNNPPETISPSLAPFAELTSSTLHLLISRHARILDITGGEELLQKMFTRVTIPPGPMRDELEKTIRQQFSASAMAEQLEANLALYPQDPVRIGNTWKRTLNLLQGMPLTVKTTYKLAKIQASSLTIELTADIRSVTATADSAEQNPLSPSYSIAGTLTGTQILDRDSGWLTGGEIRQSLTGDVTVSGMILPLSIESKVVFDSSSDRQTK
ncbi:hypothetical protein JW992_15945 [candidate division KSB1 bacterium]|nr:hypothetical protein [candidate division KSB1 bacterium]